ncbi:VOC family protein [Chitinophaga lutea]
MLLNNAVHWFEIPVMNFERAKQFYAIVLQTEINEYFQGAERRGLLHFNAAGGGAGGAIVQGPDSLSSQRGCLLYLHCDEALSSLLARVTAAGGRVDRPPAPFPNGGHSAVFLDTEGNRIGLYATADQ